MKHVLLSMLSSEFLVVSEDKGKNQKKKKSKEYVPDKLVFCVLVIKIGISCSEVFFLPLHFMLTLTLQNNYEGTAIFDRIYSLVICGIFLLLLLLLG